MLELKELKELEETYRLLVWLTYPIGLWNLIKDTNA